MAKVTTTDVLAQQMFARINEGTIPWKKKRTVVIMKKVIVPQYELDRLEKARVDLCNWIGFLEKEHNIPPCMYSATASNITGTMYQIACRKWPETLVSKIRSWWMNLNESDLAG